jgi:tetratricopeptide (TPR) repeat protein
VDVAWLVVLGVLLLVAGLSALGYDTVRRKHASHPFPYPDAPTNLLDDTAIRALTSQSHTATAMPAPTRRPIPKLLRRPRVSLVLPKFGLDFQRARRIMTSRRVLAPLLCSLMVVGGLGLVAYRAASEPSATPPGALSVAICPFGGAPPGSEPSAYLSGEIARAAASGGQANLLLLPCTLRVASSEQAVGERGGLRGGVLVWGEIGVTGDMTISLAIAPGVGPAAASWEKWTEREADALLLPETLIARVPSSASIDPLVPLNLSLAYLASGDYADAARAAGGAQATMRQASISGEPGTFLQAVALAAAGDMAAAEKGFTEASGDPDLASVSLINRAFTRLKESDYSGTRADLDRVIAMRDISDLALARAHLLRARALYRLAGDYASALPEVEEGLRLDPAYIHARLDKAEIQYRLSQPDAARAEIGQLLAKMPDAAPADRLLGLVWLMLDRPEDAGKSLQQANSKYSNWIAALRADEGKAQVTGNVEAGTRATNGVILLNRELARVHLYSGMALADNARKEPAEGFLGGLWRRIRGEPTTYEQAIAEMDAAAKLDPRSPDIPLQMGSIYASMGDTARAASTFQQAQTLDPTAPEPYLALARVQASQGNVSEAAKTLESLISQVPGAYPAYDQLYSLYARSGHEDMAKATLNRAVQIAATSAQDHLWHGKFLRTLGQNSQALTELQAAASDPALWEAHSIIGHILLDLGRGPEALAHFQAALAVQANDPDALLNAGRLYVLAGQAAQAEEMFQRLTTTSPGDADGHIAYLQLLLSKGLVDAAIAEGQRAVQADSSRAASYYNLGTAYQVKGDWPLASAQFKAATERGPKSFDAFLSLAVSLFREDKYGESVSAAEAAIKLKADDSGPYRWLAEDQIALRLPDEALHSIGKAIALSPSSGDLLAVAAHAYLLKGDTSSAMTYARKAVVAGPRNPAGQLAIGEASLVSGRPSDALQAFQDASELDPASAQGLVGQGRAYAALGDRETALKFYSRAATADGHLAEAHLYSGHVYAEMARWDDALREYAWAARQRPRWPDAQYYLGRAYLQRKDLYNARRSFADATQYGPNLVEGWFGLGIADRELGRTSDAVASLSRATQLNGSYAEAWLYLGLCYEEEGNRAAAAQSFANASASATDQAVKEQADQGLARLK